MTQHKWHREIKAWADGAEIECRDIPYNGAWGDWDDTPIDWDDADYEFRIKPQPKEPQYLYVIGNTLGNTYFRQHNAITVGETLLGKIKLENDDASTSS